MPTQPTGTGAMSRNDAIARALHYFDSGVFLRELERRVARPTESQIAGHATELTTYLTDEIVPSIAPLGFSSTIIDNPHPGRGAFLIAQRIEGDDLPTALIYGHGDTVIGYPEQWRGGLAPWRVTVEGDRWYGRGTADNKGQHTINLAALAQVMAARGGQLGFNAKILLEMGEETGSPGLRAVCRQHRAALTADVLIASDGPRLAAEQPTIFLGSRGLCNFDLVVDLRAGSHHSGNFGGLLRNPGTVLANAIASLVDARGRILVSGLRPPAIPDSVRAALRDVTVGGGKDDPAIDAGWGEPGLTNEERLFAWNALEVLAFKTGDPDAPLNAIPPNARASMQLRFVVGTDWQNILAAVRAHLDAEGFGMVQVVPTRSEIMVATRLDPHNGWVDWALRSMTQTTGKKPVLLPNLAGSLPNDIFADLLGLPTLWVPHSYPACSQHAPDEHLLGSVAREGLAIMAGLFWDLGELGAASAEKMTAAT